MRGGINAWFKKGLPIEGKYDGTYAGRTPSVVEEKVHPIQPENLVYIFSLYLVIAVYGLDKHFAAGGGDLLGCLACVTTMGVSWAPLKSFLIHPASCASHCH
jgi:hypothetical protein